MKKLLVALLFITACDKFKGDAGTPGSSCSVSQTAIGAIVTCTDGTTSTLLNGLDGLNGVNGTNGLDGSDGVNGIDGIDGSDAEIEVITLCPNLPGAFPEVLFRIEGSLYAVYSAPPKIHLSLLAPGSFQTTDGRSCNFTVTNDNQVTLLRNKQ